jgi:hypothetical protein
MDQKRRRITIDVDSVIPLVDSHSKADGQLTNAAGEEF